MEKALVLHSGGLDSTVVLFNAVKNYGSENVFALSAYYGQKHYKEIDYSNWICEKLKVKKFDVNLQNVFTFNLNCSSLLRTSKNEIEHGSYEEQLKNNKQVSTYVPYRNGLLLSYATAVALQLDCNFVLYGAHKDDSNSEIYPDCTPRFIESQNMAIIHGTGFKVSMQAPLWDLTKGQVVELGIKLGMTKEDFRHTWSCYEGKEKPCGKCGTCIDRKKAFMQNGIKDID